MNKNLQICLVVVLFLVCGVVGYFVGEAVFDGSDNVREPIDNDTTQLPTAIEAIADPVLVSDYPDIPIITNEPLEPMLNGNTYSLKVNAAVECGGDLLYCLKSTNEPFKEIASNYTGRFERITPPTNGNEYLVVVYNVETMDSVVRVVSGFEKLISSVTPLTIQEIQRSLNNTTDGTMPIDIRNRCDVNNLRVVYADGSSYNGSFNDLWIDANVLDSHIQVLDVAHNPTDNKLTKIVVKIIENLEENNHGSESTEH